MADHLKNAMCLVVDRATGGVIDCGQINYVWDIEALAERHDLNVVELIIRRCQSSKPIVAPEGDVQESDIPF